MKIMETYNKALDFTIAYNRFTTNKKLLENYNRETAIQSVQDNIKYYKSEITELSALGGRTIQYNVNYDIRTDENIISDLYYLTLNIPLYELLKQGKKEAVKALIKKFSETYNTNTKTNIQGIDTAKKVITNTTPKNKQIKKQDEN